MPKFGELLRDLRKARGLSQAGLAAALGWNQSKASYLEALEEVPKEEDLQVVCHFFGIGPDYFYSRRSDRKPNARSYLRSLAELPREASPKAAIAFYSQVGQLTREEQARAVELTQALKAKRRGRRQ